jgi:extradiol dioxygenase family protein
MNSSSVFELDPQSIWLNFSEKDSQQAEQQAAGISAAARRNASLNYLCQQIILPYLQEYQADSQFTDRCKEFWSLGINGSPITINGQCCIVLPTDALDRDELRIPQEWVECPELAADFYLAVHIDNEENLLRVWGYTTYNILKTKGHYSSRDRSYSLEQDEVCTDINSLWLLQQHFPTELNHPAIAPLPTLSLDRLTKILADLSQTNLLFLRRSLDFKEWGAVVANPQWRRMLIEKRDAITIKRASPSTNTLSKWLENRFEEGWQSVEQLIAPKLLGSFMGNQVKRAKLIDLGLDLAGHQVSLMITVGQSSTGMSVQASIYPTGEEMLLPPHLKLVILDETGQVFKEVTARSDDEFIRYKFEAQVGDHFNVKVLLGEASVIEQFQV